MKNPLIKRLPRELKGEIGKYIVLFLFITMMIGTVSGFLVAAGSMSVAYDEALRNTISKAEILNFFKKPMMMLSRR